LPVAEELITAPIQEIDSSRPEEEVPDEPVAVGFTPRTAVPEDLVVEPGATKADEILTRPSQLRQAGQAVVVPVQTQLNSWNSNTLFAGLIGLAVFALITGVVVARRGVPGAIAS
jgi:hypothetical protein